MKLLWSILIISLITSAGYGADIEEPRDAINPTQDNERKAILLKESGDHFVEVGDYEKASVAYLEALALGRSSFSIPERLRMAIVLSWAQRFKESIKELELILEEDPENLDARTNYARTLSWSGQLDKALREINTVIEKQSKNKAALLVKANILRWKGRDIEAMELYKKILNEGEDFDARLGFTYSLINTGEILLAEESTKLLKPEYPYQEKELKDLVSYLRSRKNPSISIEYNYYEDSDQNIVNTYSAMVEIPRGRWRYNLNYKLKHATDRLYNNDAHSLSLTGFMSYPNTYLSASLGVIRFANETPSTVVTGGMKVEIQLNKPRLALIISRDALTDTAFLIEKEIHFTNTGVMVTIPWTERLYTEGSCNIRYYSDNNHSVDIPLSIRYRVLEGNPSLFWGYRFRYLDFKRQTFNGYFDPDNLLAHQIFLSFNLEKERIYLYLEPYGGYQSFERYGVDTRDWFSGGSGIIGFRLKKAFFLEFYAEGGDYAGGTQTGFSYFMTGMRVKGNF